MTISEQFFPKAMEIRQETLKIRAENEAKLNKEVEEYYGSLLQILKVGILSQKSKGFFTFTYFPSEERERIKCEKIVHRIKLFLETQGYSFHELLIQESKQLCGIEICW